MGWTTLGIDTESDFIGSITTELTTEVKWLGNISYSVKYFFIIYMLISASMREFIDVGDKGNFYPPPDKLRLGVLALTQMSGRPSVCSCFISEADLGNPWEDFFHIAHTHPLGVVDVPFGVYDLWPT